MADLDDFLKNVDEENHNSMDVYSPQFGKLNNSINHSLSY
jgi:hypothetical protein